jgi:hypothetical protein
MAAAASSTPVQETGNPKDKEPKGKESAGCLPFCFTNSKGWDEKCAWASKCGGCGKCSTA